MQNYWTETHLRRTNAGRKKQSAYGIWDKTAWQAIGEGSAIRIIKENRTKSESLEITVSFSNERGLQRSRGCVGNQEGEGI